MRFGGRLFCQAVKLSWSARTICSILSVPPQYVQMNYLINNMSWKYLSRHGQMFQPKWGLVSTLLSGMSWLCQFLGATQRLLNISEFQLVWKKLFRGGAAFLQWRHRLKSWQGRADEITERPKQLSMPTPPIFTVSSTTAMLNYQYNSKTFIHCVQACQKSFLGERYWILPQNRKMSVVTTYSAEITDLF